MGLGSFLSKAVDTITGGDLLSVGGDLLGGFMGNQASAKQASQANAMSKEAMQNRHQWEAADLRAAGRNPILYSGTTPGSFQATAATQQNPIGNAVGNAMQARLIREQVKNVQADTALKNSQSAKVVSDTVNSERMNPMGKFIKQAGDNALKFLDDLPNIPNALSNSAKKVYNNGEPLRITVRPSDAKKKTWDDYERSMKKWDYIPMPPKI